MRWANTNAGKETNHRADMNVQSHRPPTEALQTDGAMNQPMK